MTYFFDNLRNRFDFFIRNKITFSRKNYTEKAEIIDLSSFNDEQIRLWENLEQKYGSELKENTGKRNFLNNIYFLNIFDKYLSKIGKESVYALDIGSKNWAYVKSEYLFFKSFAKDFVLKGIELDAYRMYSNFYTRYEVAKFYTKDLPETEYIAGDFLEHNKNYDYIIWSLPFIVEYPLIKWGLPLKYFKPEIMLKHAYELLNKDGEILIINQGEEEYEIQQNLCKKLNIPYEPLGEIEDRFNLFKNKRYCGKINK